MKIVRIVALGLALGAGSSVAALAQGSSPAGGATQQGNGRRNRPSPMMKDITLTAEQQAKVDEITRKYAPERQMISDLMPTDRPGAMAKRMELMAKVSPEIRAVLTADQQAAWDRNTAAMKAAREARAKQTPPAI